MPSIRFRGNLWLNTANDTIKSCLFKRYAATHHRRNNHLVIIEGRNTHSFTRNLCRLHKKRLRRAVPDANRKRGLRQVDMRGCFEAHIRKVICRITTVSRLTADNQVLEKSIACKALCGSGIAYLIQIIQLHPDAVNQLLRLFLGDFAFLKVATVVRIHILVEATGRNRMSA